MADKVKISDSTSTTSSVIAASCTAVKTAMDKANSAATAANTANTTAVKLTGNQTIAGTKTFSSTISGSINGTAAKATSDVNGLNIVSNYYHKGCGTNFTPSTDTTAIWSEKNPGHYWYSSDGILTGQPSQYGHLLNLGQGSEIFQLWCCAPSGPLYFRSGNSSGGWNNTSWKQLLDSTTTGFMMNSSTIQKLSVSGTSAVLPSGGTWFYFLYDGGDSSHFTSGTGAGGSTVKHSDSDSLYGAFAFRIA